MGQPEDPPDETTEEAVQTTLPTAYGGYCLQGCGARCGIKVDWGGTRMRKQREEGLVTRRQVARQYDQPCRMPDCQLPY